MVPWRCDQQSQALLKRKLSWDSCVGSWCWVSSALDTTSGNSFSQGQDTMRKGLFCAAGFTSVETAVLKGL